MNAAARPVRRERVTQALLSRRRLVYFFVGLAVFTLAVAVGGREGVILGAICGAVASEGAR